MSDLREEIKKEFGWNINFDSDFPFVISEDDLPAIIAKVREHDARNNLWCACKFDMRTGELQSECEHHRIERAKTIERVLAAVRAEFALCADWAKMSPEEANEIADAAIKGVGDADKNT